jgi:hypothetical protein
VFPSNFEELPPALFVTDEIKSDESFEKLPNVHKEDFNTTNDLKKDDYMTKKCPECNFYTPNPKKLRMHIRKVHKKKKTEIPKPHICSKCDKSYTTAKSLKQHFGLKHEGKKLKEFKDLPLAARIKHVLYQDEIKFEDQSQNPSQSPSSETNSEMACSEINSSERTIPYINSFYDEFDNPMNEEDFSTQVKFKEPSQASSSETDSGFNCSERKSSDTNSLSDEIENPNETLLNNSGFKSSDNLMNEEDLSQQINFEVPSLQS